jgi:hypothetical protein
LKLASNDGADIVDAPHNNAHDRAARAVLSESA